MKWDEDLGMSTVLLYVRHNFHMLITNTRQVSEKFISAGRRTGTGRSDCFCTDRYSSSSKGRRSCDLVQHFKFGDG